MVSDPARGDDDMKRVLALGVVFLWLGVVGCANMTPRQQRALSGGAMGAAGGTAVGAIVGGSPTIGAAVGGAAGTAAGALWEDINRALK
jgi:osmotically inducible lipoprotein OsmB